MIRLVGREEHLVRKALAFTVAAAASLTLATGCDSDDSDDTGAPAPSVPVVGAAAAASAGTAAGRRQPRAQRRPRPHRAAPGEAAEAQDRRQGRRVLALQQRLTELGYWNGKADGKFGGTTQQAVYALQKAAGIGRDGVVGPKTQKALDQGVRPKAKQPSSGYVVEINLKRQLLMLVDDGKVTPGLQHVDRLERALRAGRADLPGRHPGGQVQGRPADRRLAERARSACCGGRSTSTAASRCTARPSVPPYPASHGCARLSISAMNWLWTNDKIPLKTKVWVYRS